MSRLPWFRFFDDYFTSPSHAGLSGRDLWIGAVIMSFVRSTCDHLGELQPWALLPTGKPITIAGIANKARESVADVDASILALLDTGTFTRREDGALGMPKFPEKQRGESTERAARSKAKKAATAFAPVLELAPASVSDLAPPIKFRTGHVTVASAPAPGVVARMTAITDITEKLQYGWNNHGPLAPKGLPSLTVYRPGLSSLLEDGMTPAAILEAVEQVAELVEADVLDAEDWAPSKVFSAYLGGFRLKYAKWKKERERKANALAPTPDEPSAPPMDFDSLAAGAAAQARKLKGGNDPCTS